MELNIGDISTAVSTVGPILASVSAIFYKVNQIGTDLKELTKEFRDNVVEQTAVRIEGMQRLARLEALASNVNREVKIP